MGGTWSGWVEQEKINMVNTMKSSTRRPNVLLVGRPGAGKSSLATTLESAITGKPAREVASAGSFVSGESFTFRLRRHEMFIGCDGVKITDKCKVSAIKNKLPVIYDMPGMLNVDDDRVTAIFRCILQGRVPSGEAILVSAGMTGVDIENEYGERADQTDHMIDRVVFVQSKTESLPDNLIKGVVAICNELDITIFSVMTKYDRSDRACKYDELAEVIGTKGSPRGFEVQLYHSGMSNHGRYDIDNRTNYYMLLLWQMLVNEHYPIHSTS